MEVFTTDWATALCNNINNNEAYRESSQNWEGSLVMQIANVSQEDGTPKAVFLDLWHGKCRKAYVAQQNDTESADYVLSANADSWNEVLHGQIAPIMALMRGKIKLQKGSLATLTRYANSAKELVKSAQNLNANIPSEWLTTSNS